MQQNCCNIDMSYSTAMWLEPNDAAPSVTFFNYWLLTSLYFSSTVSQVLVRVTLARSKDVAMQYLVAFSFWRVLDRSDCGCRFSVLSRNCRLAVTLRTSLTISNSVFCTLLVSWWWCWQPLLCLIWRRGIWLSSLLSGEAFNDSLGWLS